MEGIQVEVDVETGTAVLSIGRLTEAFINGKSAVQAYGEAIGQMEATTAGATSTVGQFTLATQNASTGASGMGASVSGAATQQTTFNTTIAQTNVQLVQNNVEMTQVNATQNQAAASARSWISGLTGAGGIGLAIQLAQTLIERFREANEAMQELNEGRAKTLLDNQTIAQRFQVDERKAAAAVYRTAVGASTTEENARAAVAAAGDAGIDPTKNGSPGAAFAIELAKLAAVTGATTETLSKVAKADINAGGGTAASLDALLDKMLAAVPRGMDPKSYIDQVSAGVLGELSRGQKPDDALAIMGTLMQGMRDPGAAAQGYKQLRTLTEKGNATANKFFAPFASQYGVTDVAPVTDDDVNAAADAESTPGAKRLGDRRQALADEQRRVALERRKLLTTFKPDARAATKERLREADEKIEAETRDIATIDTKYRADELIRRQVAAYERLTPAEKLERVIAPAAAAAKTPEQQAALSAATSARAGDAIFALAEGGPGSLQAGRQRVEAAAGSNQLGQRFQRYVASETAKDAVAKARRDQDEMGATNAGTAYAQRLYEDAVSQRKIEAGGGVDTSSMLGVGKSIATSKDRGVAQNFAKKLGEDFDRFEGDKSVSYAEHQQIDVMAEQFKAARGGGANAWSSASALQNLNEYAAALGDVREGHDERMLNEAGGAHPADRSTPAARQAAYAKANPGWKSTAYDKPVDDSMTTDEVIKKAVAEAVQQLKAGDTNVTHNHNHTYSTTNHNSVGTYHSGDADPFDKPGALEQSRSSLGGLGLFDDW